MDKTTLELYRNRGNVPDRFYYQLNGKNAFENLIEIHKRMQEDYNKREEEKKQEERIAKEIGEKIEQNLDSAIEKALLSGKSNIDIKINL